ncbi:uncharacterized protein LOC144445434 [Glandiceps talaboti]
MGRIRTSQKLTTWPILVLLLAVQNACSQDENRVGDIYESCQREVDALRLCASKSASFTARFTTLDTYGRYGPTTIGDHYKDLDHEHLVRLEDGIQTFTVPYSGTYVIETAGAAGGYDGEQYKQYRGKGAVIRGTFHLTKGIVLNILVGQESLNGDSNLSSGGGGGTYVTLEDGTPLIIAGGGGGAFWLESSNPLCDGTKSTTGNPGGGRGFTGGASGHGAPSNDYKYSGGGGGGLLTRGGGWSGNDGRQGGHAFVDGGLGGEGGNRNLDGGFGGGGGTRTGGGGPGGGGGYSGGGSGDYYTGSCAGGGGSYNSGSNKDEQSGANSGPGYVTITKSTQYSSRSRPLPIDFTVGA